MTTFGTVTDRLARNAYVLDKDESRTEEDPDGTRSTSPGSRQERSISVCFRHS